MAEVQEQNVGSSSSNRPKRLKVWNGMTKYRDKDGNEKAECKYCKKTFDGSSKKGTTYLKIHLERCRAKRKGGGHEDKTVTTGDSANTIVIKERSPIDQINHSIDAERFTTVRCGPSILNSRKVCEFHLRISEVLRFVTMSQLWILVNFKVQISLGVPMESPQSVASIFKSSVIAKPKKHKSDFFAPSGIGVLEVHIHQARDIRDIGVYHKQDVYATLCLTSDPENTVTTNIIYAGGSNPVFNESRQLKVKTVDSSIKCEIFTVSRIKSFVEDQLLGFTLVPLSEVLLNNGKLDKEFSLSSTDFLHSPAGFVQLSLRYASDELKLMKARPKK
ncbi:hypothetical protein WN944_016070 [Citrus x changshan-huyou]|uniref:C2 domain-containing protein n=1 Tax=Citrus x changshan-huyou TaxID=2935761 RepID=A0AAP0QME7_9ROSI